MTEAQAPASVTPAMPGTPPSFLGALRDKDTSISTASTPERDLTNTNTNNKAVYTNTIPIPRKDYIASIKVPREIWKRFLTSARSLGYSGNELINHFINSIVTNTDFPSKTPLNFNIAIAKAESKPIININQYIAEKELNDLLENVRKLKERADRERQERDMPLSFTVDRAKILEDAIKKTLKSLRSLDSEKLREVEAALAVLKGIKEVKR
ncbi:MAG: hypothetical protein ABC611_08320 [Candidatus Methanosuratincola petrocarbonis]